MPRIETQESKKGVQRVRRRRFNPSFSRRNFHRLLPNIATIASLCAGMSAIRFAILERWEAAVAFILLSAILDGMDGRLARMLGSVSRFGAQLDSLADFVSFGVAPGFILYFFSLKQLGNAGWAVALIFAVCMAMRLARFNAQIETTPLPSWRAQFFTGVPAPAAAVLSLTPLMIWFDQEWAWARLPWVIALIALMASVLMISRIPTYAFKTLKVSSQLMMPLLLLVAIMVAALMSMPWRTILFASALYLILIPHSFLRCRTLQRREEASAGK